MNIAKQTAQAAALLLGVLMLAPAASAEDDGHRYGAWVTKREATCTQEGHQFKYCLDCDHWEQRYTSKLPHTPDEWALMKEPTCTEAGVRNAHCTVCGGYLRVEIDPLGHDWTVVSASTEPTCSRAGYGDLICRRCGRTKTGSIARLEHEWSEWTILEAPAEGSRGLRERTCVLCGETESEHFYEEGTLYEDMEPSEEVIALQQMLRDLGYYSGSIRSGVFGSLTGKAVAKFQEANGLPATRVADPATRAAIKAQWETLSGGNTAVPSPDPQEE